MQSDRYAPSRQCERAVPVHREPAVTRVPLSGEIDLTNAAAIGARLCAVVDGSRDVVVDLHAVTFMDARGIEACVLAQRHAHVHGCDMRFTNPQGIVARVIEILGLEPVLLGVAHG